VSQKPKIDEDEQYIREPLFYLGNPNLKKVGVEVEWTPELMREYARCKNDVLYFVEKYIKIINVDEGLVPFKMYRYQKKMLRSMAIKRRTIITTARQVGKSTVTSAFIVWYIIFNKDKTVAMLANKGDTAREILGRVQLAYEHLPLWLQQGVKEWNKGSMLLENNSRVLAGSTSTSAIRGYSINLLFIDEAAHIENWEDFFTSVFPTISSGKTTKIILVSTPFGLNHFHKLWEDAINKRNNYSWILVTWDKVPGRDEKWKQMMIADSGGDLEKFEQEQNCAFLGSSGTLINGSALKNLVERPYLVTHENFTQYFIPEENHKYACIADVSRGKGLDYSAASIIDVTQMPYQQVAVYRSNLTTPADYAEVLWRISKMYNNAMLLVEINDIGEQVSHTVYDEYEYENILFTESAGRAGKRISGGFGGMVDKGIRTTKTVKSIGCSLLKLLIEQQQLIINDKNTIDELKTFSKKGQSYEAEAGKHDDLVMGLVLFGWLSDQQYFKEMTDINTLMKLRDKSEEDIMDDMLPFGFVDRGESIEEIMAPAAPEWVFD
jgi:hypothetical protein